MPRKVDYLAREIARKAGYDPDQLVIEIDKERDFDFFAIGVAPVDIKRIRPIFMNFYPDAEKIMLEKGELCNG